MRGVGSIAACCVALMGVPAEAGAAPAREAAPFFGMNIQKARDYDPAQVDAMAAELQRLGVGSVRVGFPWNAIEAEGPGRFRWEHVDPTVGSLARNGIRALPMIVGTPTWAVAAEYRSKPDPKVYPPENASHFAQFAGAVAERYGAGGAFWSETAGVEPQPIAAIELWNEPNMSWGFMPSPDPAHYGRMARAATEAINAARPEIVAVVGGLDPTTITDPGRVIAMTEFLGQMGASGIEAIALHPYGLEPVVFGHVARLRSWMDARGLATVPIFVTEWGYPDERFAWEGTRGLEEQARGALYRSVTSSLSRSDCNVAEVHPHTWDSDEGFVNEYDARHTQWSRYLGLAQPRDAGFEVFGETEELGRASRELLGLEGRPARATMHVCDRAEPDRDGDRVADQHDYAPLDPRVQAAPASAPPASFERPVLRVGDFAVGRTVRTTLGTWDGSPVPALTVLRWDHCAADGSSCQAVSASASRSVTLPEVTAGRRVRAVVRAANASGQATATTDLSEVVGIAPRMLTKPYLGGTFKSGRTVWMHPGTWKHIPSAEVLYQWSHCAGVNVDCRPIGPPQTSNTLTLNVAHVNRYIKGVVTFRNRWGEASAVAWGPKVTLF